MALIFHLWITYPDEKSFEICISKLKNQKYKLLCLCSIIENTHFQNCKKLVFGYFGIHSVSYFIQQEMEMIKDEAEAVVIDFW